MYFLSSDIGRSMFVCTYIKPIGIMTATKRGFV